MRDKAQFRDTVLPHLIESTSYEQFVKIVSKDANFIFQDYNNID